MGDSVPKHAGPISLTDTPLEPSISRTRPTTTRESPRDGKPSSPERFKLLAEASFVDRNSLLSSTSLSASRQSCVPVSDAPSSAAFPCPPAPHKSRAEDQDGCWQRWQHF